MLNLFHGLRFFVADATSAGARSSRRIGGGRGRFILILLKGTTAPLRATLLLDEGPARAAPTPWKLESGRVGVCVVAPELSAGVEQIHLAIEQGGGKVAVLVFATRSVALLKMIAWAASRIWRSGLASPAGRRFIGEDPAFPALKDAFARRVPAANSAQAHFRHVVDLAEAQSLGPVPLAPARRELLLSFVVPVYNARPEYLDDLLASAQIQAGGLCEFVLSDDGSTSEATRKWLDAHAAEDGLTIVRGPENKGIASATNAGIARCVGEWIGLVDHDDALAPFAAARIAEALENAPACRFLYTDEVIADAKLRPVDCFFKPAWDPALLSGVNYVNHLSLYRRDRLAEIGGLRDGFQGSQDYDLLLRYTAGLEPSEILHLPYPAYIWRRDGTSFSAQFLETATANARRALAERYAQGSRPAVVDRALSPDLHRIRFDAARLEWPLISVVVPSRDALPLISRLLEGLTAATDYPALEIIVIDNGSRDPAVLALYERFRAGAIAFRARVEDEPFNFSRSVNRGIAMARGDHVLLLNNDIEILEPDWLKEMVSCLDFPDAGVVGAKLLYPNRTIQHVGVIAGLGGLAGHWYTGREENFPGPMGRLRVRQSLSAVTGACMLISRACLERTGALDEAVFGIAYNDVDFCLRAGAEGFRVIWTPFATLVHHESASRGSDETPQNIARFRRDQQSLRERHGTHELEDRAFSPWYAKDRAEPVPLLLGRLPDPR